ncbi:PREDICTED: transcription factor 7 [Nanorana parkeri]|uniref:transcription factor 7 n=1 Tax=Nanorana parkeri TaxID=125878 RepID=UPI00085495B4|nr:PREDICTED: transcription factor 7 [Nanorana parkeri]
MRIGELVSPSKAGRGGLQRCDVAPTECAVSICIRRSKTDQLGKELHVELSRGAYSSLCLIRALGEFLGVRPDGDGPLFIHLDGLGANAAEYSAHPFRIGTATEAARWGLDESTVLPLEDVEGVDTICYGAVFPLFTGSHRPSQTPDIPAFYSIPAGGVGQISPSMGWQSQPVYPLSSCGFRQPYSSSLSTSASYSRFTHPLMLGSGVHTTGIPHPAIVPHSGNKEIDCYDRNIYGKHHSEPKREKEPKKPTIKKPLNAFMLYMKEMRAKVIAECTLKDGGDSVLRLPGGTLRICCTHLLDLLQRQLHMQLYPGWSARDNYVSALGKKKRRTREKPQDSSSDPGSPKKCRARFGLNQQTDWCGPCRRKKKCIRYLQGEGRCSSPISSDGSAIDSPSSPVNSLQSIEISACSSCTLTYPDDSAQSEKNFPPPASDKAEFPRPKALVSLLPSEESTAIKAT